MDGHRSNRELDEGTGYGRPKQHSNDLLTQVGPGTPCGEFMRRYWQPVLTSANVTTTPKKVRILGEDLIVFRDRKGRPGLLYPRCMHRGTTLFYGKVEEEGIRCCYHGWLFDVEGRVLDQPCEPEHGLHRDKVRQPWYPVQEQYGIVFAYMGPPEKMPVLPRYDIFEHLKPGEALQANDESWGATRDYGTPVVPYSWLQMNDNIMDPFHVYVLHSTFTSFQFVPEFAVPPTVDFSYVDEGICYSAYRRLDDGREVDRVSSGIVPNIMCVPNTQLTADPPKRLAWVVPVDDSHYRMIGLAVVTEKTAGFTPMRIKGKTWSQMTEAERQDDPNDYEAQAGQGPITLHSEEHLATSDRGVAMHRRLLEQQIKMVQEGGDPINVIRDPAKALIKIRSGNFFKYPEKSAAE
jgi:nitrite reductase/ring-hydroxylating ferredoxin subunit